jgi:hypothetical protein
MRGADTFTESLFTMRRLDDFVPADHPLRVIRVMVNKALKEHGPLFAQMYAADIKGGRPSIAPEKLLRAMLLQVLLQRALGTPAHGADPVQPAVSLVHRPGHGRCSLGAHRLHQEPRTPDRARCGHRTLQSVWPSPGAGTALGRALQRGRHPHPGLGGTQELCAQRRQGDDDTDAGNFKDQSAATTPTNHHRRGCPAVPQGQDASELRYMGHTSPTTATDSWPVPWSPQADGYAEREAAKAMINDARQARPAMRHDDHAGRGQGLRRQGIHRGTARDERAAPCGAEQIRAPICGA